MRIEAKKLTSVLVLALAAALVPVASGAQALASSTGGTSAPPSSSATASNKSHSSSTPAPAPGTKVKPSGVATWFGPGFYGKKTACGQTLTPAVVGVAHRTLPCGTLVKVAYAGHSLIVPVLDRGPYSHIADWDLTAGAAQALGITDTVRIGTRVVGRTADVPSLGAPLGEAGETIAGGAAAAPPAA
ncbi:MAG TPA: septal ring lytic transglycosylase RlpA family protein [Solirubrobacteraceae bacterium]|jgi:rare lipoprotein A (peptidoglycan hydrolase)